MIDQMDRNIERDSYAYKTAIIASALIAILIAASWLAHGVSTEQAPRVGYLLFGLWDIGHSRYWDAFIGLYGMVFLFLLTMDRGGEPGGLAEDIVAIVAATILGFILAYVFRRHGVNLAGWRFLAAVWIGGFVLATLIPFARTFRFGIIIYAALAFGFSLYAGVLLGSIMSVALGVAYLGGALARAAFVKNPLGDTTLIP